MTAATAIPVEKGARRRPKASARARRETLSFYAFISPWLVGFVLLSVIPLLFGLFISFTNYDGLNLFHLKLVGAANYLRAFRDANVLFATKRTLVYAAVAVPLNLVISFCIALALTQRLRARGIFRTIFYLPTFIPIVAVTWIWKLMLDKNVGLVNGILSMLKPGLALNWLFDYSTLSLIMMTLWVGLGGAMIIFLAGLQGIPRELEEAALIDGANLFQMFRHVTLPLMTPVIFYQLIITMINAFQIIQEPILLAAPVTGGGATLTTIPPRPNYLYMVHTYGQIFTNQRFGYGTALLWLLFISILVLTLVIFRTSRYWVYYENPVEGEKA